MTVKSWLLIACLAVGDIALGQSPSAPATPGASGTGPGVSIQAGPNGTLDVGGARAGDLDLMGGNLLGRLGASRPQPMLTAPAPSLPSAIPPGASFGLPGYALPGGRNFGGLAPALPPSPRENSSERAGTSGRDSRKAEMRDDPILDLILPRFRSAVRNKLLAQPVIPRASAAPPAEVGK